MNRAIVYSETVVHVAPERLASEAPYQIAIAQFADGTRRTVRITGSNRVAVGDEIESVETRDGVDYFALVRASKEETVSKR